MGLIKITNQKGRYGIRSKATLNINKKGCLYPGESFGRPTLPTKGHSREPLKQSHDRSQRTGRFDNS